MKKWIIPLSLVTAMQLCPFAGAREVCAADHALETSSTLPVAFMQSASDFVELEQLISTPENAPERIQQNMLMVHDQTGLAGKAQELSELEDELSLYEITYEGLPRHEKIKLTQMVLSNRREDKLKLERIKAILEEGINYFEMSPARQEELLLGHY